MSEAAALPELSFTGNEAVLSGEWTLAAVGALGASRRRALFHALSEAGKTAQRWRLDAVLRLDSAIAILLWRHWQGKFPAELSLPDALRPALERVAVLPAAKSLQHRQTQYSSIERLGLWSLAGWREAFRFATGLIELLGSLVLTALRLIRHSNLIPWKEFSANLYRAGFEALPVSALVGILIGMTISYLSSAQLKIYGADIFIVNLLGMGIIRELGPVLAAVLVAGRSGSAMTAQIGVMRVTEEIDALAALGVSSTLRVVFPKVAALVIVMPLLAVWVCMSALLGGALAAYWELDFSMIYFFQSLPNAVPLANLWICLGKGVVFGFLIALLACWFGLKVRPNTESLSRHTTASVVTAITLVILADAVFAILTRGIGLPWGG